MDVSFFTRSNRLVYILIGSIAILLFLTVVLVLGNIGGGSTERVILEFWGVFDESSAFAKSVRLFEAQNPNIKVIYTKLAFEDYERNVVSALAANSGPDLWMIHNTWLPKHADKLQPLPAQIAGEKNASMTLKEFKDTFVDVAYQDLVRGGKIYSMPLYVDTLALYYNKDMLNSAGFATPPDTWGDFNNVIKAVTRQNGAGNIIQSGAALGTARNVNRSTDILENLMIQSGVQMTSDDGTSATFTRSVDNQAVGEIALQYYTDFANPQKEVYTWNDSQHYSVDAFAEGSTAMMFNYSHYVPLLKDKASRLNFAVAPMPQLSQLNNATFASYWTPAVSLNSKHADAAWKFITFMAQKQNSLDYVTETKRPGARRDIIALQQSDLDLGVFASQALTAKSWLQIDNTAIESIFADMIDDVNFKRAKLSDALQNAESRVNVLMHR
jgi:multiple sugar transport system substrate-binding protein